MFFAYVYMRMCICMLQGQVCLCVLGQYLYITRIGSIANSIRVCYLHQLVRAHATLSVYEYVCT